MPGSAAAVLFLLPITVLHVAAQPAPNRASSGVSSGAPNATVETEALAKADNLRLALDNKQAAVVLRTAVEEIGPSFLLLTRLVQSELDHAGDLVNAGDKSAEDTYRQTLSTADKLLETYPNEAQSHFYKAVVLGRLAQFLGGKKKVEIGWDVKDLCERAVELDPEFAPAYVALGVFNREVASLSWFQRTAARALFGGVPPGSHDESSRLLQKAVSLDPGMSIAHWELAETLRQMGRDEEAVKHLKRVVELPVFNSDDVRNRQAATELLASSARSNN